MGKMSPWSAYHQSAGTRATKWDFWCVQQSHQGFAPWGKLPIGKPLLSAIFKKSDQHRGRGSEPEFILVLKPTPIAD